MSGSMLTSKTQIDVSTPIPPHITKSQVLAFLHDTTKMLALNPLVSECKSFSAEETSVFFKTVPTKNQPADMDTCKLFHITEDADARSAKNGTWTKKFVPDKVTYDSSYERTPTGMVTITHAPMGVSSVTTWVVKGEQLAANGNGVIVRGKDRKDGKEAAGMKVEMTGIVQSNAVLMQFIKRMLPGDYQELVDRFGEALREDVDGGVGGDKGDVEKV